MRLRRKRLDPMPDRFYPLATYNAEVSRGVIHTDEYRERMAALQSDFDEWQRTRLTAP